MSKCRYDLSEDCNNTNCLTCVLDKIRAEIKALEYLNIEDGSNGYDKYIEQYEVLKIIDKYKAESDNPIVETPLAFDTGGHTYGAIGGDEAMRRFEEGEKE